MRYCLIILMFILGCDKIDARHDYSAAVEKVWGAELLLNTGQHVWLIGVRIPDSKDTNYSIELWDDIRKLLEGKKIKIKTILKKHSSGYPKLDLVKIFLDEQGTSVNEYLLSNGKAFFNEDYWNKQEKEHFRELEELAKRNKIGLWSNKDRLKLLLLRDKNWKLAYSPDCKFTQDIPIENRIEYYTPPPNTPRKGILIDTSCAEPDPSVFAPEPVKKK